jgi:hypothetical protein
MSSASKRPLLWFWLTAGLIAGLLAVGCWLFRGGLRPDASGRPDMADWDIPRLAGCLHDRGVPLHVTPTARNAPVGDTAYLSEDEWAWEDLVRLPATRESANQWQGVVYCERVGPHAGSDYRVARWGDACLDAPPFLFFGDRDLLGRIDGALNRNDRPA